MAALHIVAFAFLTVTLLGGGFAVTDEEFQSIDLIVAKIISELKGEIGELKVEIQQLKGENGELKEIQDQEIRRLSDIAMRHEAVWNSDNRKWKTEVLEYDVSQNNTIDERVALLEIQVADLREDVTVVQGGVVELDQDVDFLFDEQVIQDERLLNLEDATDSIYAELLTVDDELEGLQDTTLDLDFRVTVIEENGNQTVSELQVKVETLEETAADHETRLTVAETNIEALQATDVNHDARILTLEESLDTNTIAFHSVMTSYDTIPVESAVIFNRVILNKGGCYDNATGVFTVPPGGDGVYYFSTYLLVITGQYARIDIRINDDVICSTLPDHYNNGASDYVQGFCSTMVDVVAGDQVQVIIFDALNDTPLVENTAHFYTGFNGFRI